MLQILWGKKRKVKMGQIKVHDLVIKRKYFITLERPEAELTSLIESYHFVICCEPSRITYC